MNLWALLAEGRFPHLYPAGQIIYLQGTQADHFYYLSAGSARSFITSEQGEERVLTVHRTGDLMGEASFFDECPRVSSAVAVTDCQIISIDRNQLNAIFAQHPELALPMLQYLARTVRLLSGHVDSAFLPAERRIARQLLAFPQQDDGSILCTHEELGQAVGISRVTVSRVLAGLAQRGWLRTSYGKLFLLDTSALKNFSDNGQEKAAPV